jgi:CheY-like chemotaxis protein
MASRAPLAGEPRSGSGRNGRGLVLLADDSALTCELFGEYLTHRGFTVVSAHDGETAIDVARDSQPDVIVMDLSMPRISGVAAIRRLKEDERTQRIPIVVLTGRVLPANQQAAVEAGAEIFLIKPCLPDEIERVISDLLQRAA